MYFNIGVIVLYLFCLFRGAKRGFLLQIIGSIGTVASFLVAWRYCGFAGTYYDLWPKDITPFSEIPSLSDALYDHLNEVAWFIVLFIVIRLLFLLLEKLCAGLSEVPVIRELSGLLGGLFGVVSATVWVLLFSTVLNLPFFVHGHDMVERTLIGTVSHGTSELVTQFAGPISASDAVGTLYEEARQLDGKDKEFLSEWLSEHGFEPMEEEDDAE